MTDNQKALDALKRIGERLSDIDGLYSHDDCIQEIEAALTAQTVTRICNCTFDEHGHVVKSCYVHEYWAEGKEVTQPVTDDEVRVAVEFMRLRLNTATFDEINSKSAKCIETLIRAATAPKPCDAPEVVTGWQPIDTCPDDGTIVLLAWPNSIKKFVTPNAHLPEWEMEVREYCTLGTHGSRSWHGQATHWMSLPSPPNGIKIVATQGDASMEGK